MTDNEAKADDDKLAIELYKIAFARLNFQDEYLFKFSTEFLTAHGALAVLAGTGTFKGADPNYSLLTIVAAVGGITLPAGLGVAWVVTLVIGLAHCG